MSMTSKFLTECTGKTVKKRSICNKDMDKLQQFSFLGHPVDVPTVPCFFANACYVLVLCIRSLCIYV